jgi:hypothetical protein
MAADGNPAKEVDALGDTCWIVGGYCAIYVSNKLLRLEYMYDCTTCDELW